MVDWVLVIFLSTATVSETQVITGFTSKERCEKAGDDLVRQIGRNQIIAQGGAYKLNGASYSCETIEK